MVVLWRYSLDGRRVYSLVNANIEENVGFCICSAVTKFNFLSLEENYCGKD